MKKVHMARADGVEIICANKMDMCEKDRDLVAQYPILFSRVFAEAHQYLDAWSGKALLAERNILALAVRGETLIAALSIAPANDGTKPMLTLKGLVSDGSAPKLASPLIASSMRYVSRYKARSFNAQGIVREISGVPNFRSAMSFTDNGYVCMERSCGPVDPKGVHLLLDQPSNNNTIAVHRYVGQDQRVLNYGDIVLRKWKDVA